VSAAPLRIERNVAMATRDGVRLLADIIRPDIAAPIPALICRTPYDKNARMNALAHIRPIEAAKAGFAVIIQDIRGRFSSEGDWTVMGWDDIERKDGFDCVEWAAKLPWCNGRVGLIGVSYEGLNALAAAQEQPPSLCAIAPALLGSADARRTTMMLEGVILSWSALMAMDIVEKRRARGEDAAVDLGKVMSTLVDPALAATTLPLTNLPPLTVAGMPTYQSLVDRILEASESVSAGMDRIAVPCLWTTGWWDQAGGSDFFRAVRSRGATATARGESRMIIGPWSHTQHDTVLGDLGFGQLASLASSGVSAAHIAFFARHLLENDTSLPVVRYFLTGRNVWQEADDWPPPATVQRSFYLDADGPANSVAGAGRLTETLPSSHADHFRYDPADPVPSIGWRALNLGGSTVSGPFDQARIERRDDVLVYTSDRLGSGLEVVGDAAVHLYVSSSAPDTDFVVKLCDVTPDDISRNVADGFVRVRWRDQGKQPQLIRPDEIVELRIDLGLVGHAFRPDHRIRLQVTSSAFPHIDRNMNTGHTVGTDERGDVAEQTLHHSRSLPSRLLLPVRP
jgi:uncharacterized protein